MVKSADLPPTRRPVPVVCVASSVCAYQGGKGLFSTALKHSHPSTYVSCCNVMTYICICLSSIVT